MTTTLAITDTRAELLRAIDNDKVTEDWNNDQPGEIRNHEYAGRTTRVTGKVRVMKTVGLCETHPDDADMHIRRLRLTDAGRKALADYDAKENS